jgi:hypothetical protein
MMAAAPSSDAGVYFNVGFGGPYCGYGGPYCGYRSYYPYYPYYYGPGVRVIYHRPYHWYHGRRAFLAGRRWR